MRTLNITETTLVSGSVGWGTLSEGQQVTAGLAFASGAILGWACASVLSTAMGPHFLVGLMIKGAGAYLGMELGGAIWEANNNLAYYNNN